MSFLSTIGHAVASAIRSTKNAVVGAEKATVHILQTAAADVASPGVQAAVLSSEAVAARVASVVASVVPGAAALPDIERAGEALVGELFKIVTATNAASEQHLLDAGLDQQVLADFKTGVVPKIRDLLTAVK